MKPDCRFLNRPMSFWANVRSISETVGYTLRSKKSIRIPSFNDMRSAMKSRNLETAHIFFKDNSPTELGQLLHDYFVYRADILNRCVEPNLMDAARAKAVFLDLKAALNPSCPLPMNKQKGEKRAEAYLTGIVNMLIEANKGAHSCDYDPRALTTITKDGAPLRTLARRIDGAFPSTVNPIAVWEVKEYYYTTTFGSRVADGVYETLLDGMELAELREHENHNVLHYLILDAYYTWWDCGRSYLCRIIDTMHMGFIDEVLFGHEVVEAIPRLVNEWVELLKNK